MIPEFDMPAHASIWGAGYPDLTISCPDGQTLLDPTGPVYVAFDNLLTEFIPLFRNTTCVGQCDVMDHVYRGISLCVT